MVDLDDKVDHLFEVGMEFNKARAGTKSLMYNKLYAPTFEKGKALDSSKRIAFQILKILLKDNNMLFYKYTKKLIPPCWKKFHRSLFQTFELSDKKSWLESD